MKKIKVQYQEGAWMDKLVVMSLKRPQIRREIGSGFQFIVMATVIKPVPF